MQHRGGVFFLDFEAFQHGDEDYQIKELCVMDAANPLRIMSYIFAPPSRWDLLTSEQKATYRFQKERLHRLSWHEGFMRYCNQCVQRDISIWVAAAGAYSLNDSLFYTIGEQKAEFLNRQFPNLNIMCYPVELKRLPPVSSHMRCIYREHGRLRRRADHHHHRADEKIHCAMLKCYKMYLHYCFAR